MHRIGRGETVPERDAGEEQPWVNWPACATVPSMEASGIDRRKAQRLPDDFPGLMTQNLCGADIRAVRVRDLGGGGACAVTDFAPEVDAEFYAGFFLKGFGGIPLIAKVRVAWTKPEGAGHAIGLEFLCEGPAQVDSVIRIRDYLAARRREMLASAS